MSNGIPMSEPSLTSDLFPQTSSQEGSHARTSPSLAKGQASQENAQVSGRISTEPFLYYDPVTLSWKTSQRCFFEGWDEFSETFPKSGMMRSGKLYQRQPLVQGTDESECLLWRTPQAQEAGAKIETLYTKDGQPAKVGQRAYRQQPDGRRVLQSVTLNQQVQMWATPTTMDSLPPKSAEALNREATIARPGRSKPANLRDQVSNMHLWPTPRARSGASRKPGTGGKCLQEEALKRHWPTPKTGDWRSGSQRKQFNTQLNVEVFRSEGIVPTGIKTQRNPQLNPDWVEWLMGYPIGYTALVGWATPSSHKSQRKSDG